MISTAEALARVLALCPRLPSERVALADCAGRILAEPLAARRMQPPFDASAMDGYAIRAADAGPGVRLRVAGAAPAGHGFAGRIGPGEALRIFTGAPVPDGADSVVIQEEVSREGEEIVLAGTVERGAHLRPAGGDFQPGHELAAPRRLRPADLMLAAAMNHAALPVVRQPEVALIATGDELVMPGEAPREDQIIASNAFGLKALLEAEGARVRLLPIARDSAASHGAAFDLAEGADLVVTIGGASVGEHDLVREVASGRGLALDFYKVAMRPGKPLMAGRLGTSMMVGLPGNPVSAMVCGHIFLRPALRAMLGLAPEPLPRGQAALGVALGPNGPREHYMRARLADGVAVPFPDQDSSLMSVLAGADVLVVRPPGDGPREAGETVETIAL